MSIQINKRVIWIASVFMIQEYLGLQEGNSTTDMTLFILTIFPMVCRRNFLSS